MLRDAEVPQMMTRVQTAIVRSERDGGQPGRPLVVDGEGDAEFPMALFRTRADIQLDRPSGSARPLVGPAVRLAKKVVRRGLRWYVAPIMEQQTRFNHTLLDLVEKLRLQNERLRADLEALGQSEEAAGPPVDQ